MVVLVYLMAFLIVFHLVFEVNFICFDLFFFINLEFGCGVVV